jgi:hypothetical protein
MLNVLEFKTALALVAALPLIYVVADLLQAIK